MFALCTAFSLHHWRSRRERIVEEPAHQIPMVQTSPEVLEMALDEQKPDEEAGQTLEEEVELATGGPAPEAEDQSSKC